MKTMWLLAAVVVAGNGLVALADDVQRVYVPAPNDPNAYQPQMAPKPLPPAGYVPGLPPGPPPGSQVVAPAHALPNEDAFVAAYNAHRDPRIMVFVNRTIQGDPLPKDGLEELLRTEEHQTSTGAVNVASNQTSGSNSQSTNSSYTGNSASNTNTNSVNSGSFSSQGPADYTHTTSVKQAAAKYDTIGASADDYAMIEASIVKYFDNSGKVTIEDAEAARGKLSREDLLRVENGDPAAEKLLQTELQQDILIRVSATPTAHASVGNAVRLVAKAVSTADARMLATSFVDMPLPITKTNINIYTGYLANDLMSEMTKKWTNATDTVQVRIYKVATVDDSLKIRDWLKKTRGVAAVTSRGATGGTSTSYATFAVNYGGAPEDLYADLKDAIGESQGIKAVDLQSTTITLEVTGTLNLVTTTRKSETTTTTTTTEQQTITPINPAGGQ